MTDVVQDFKRIAIVGDLKFISIQTSAACDTGHLLDLNSDAADGRAAECQEILNVVIHDDAGLIEEVTWDPVTGIITMGTLTATGIHNILVICR